MKTLKITLALLVSVIALVSFSQAQTTATLDDAALACHGIVMKNGEVNSTLGGVRPSGVNPSVHPAMMSHMTTLNGFVTTTESALAATSDPNLVPFRGQLTTAMTTLSGSTGYLCHCISTGDIGGAMSGASAVRSDFQNLRRTATDIRGEIQKGKGGSGH